MKKLVALVLLVIAVSGCRPLYLQTVEPTGPAEYQLGWEDGCDTGISAYGAYYYQLMYGFKNVRKWPAMTSTNKVGTKVFPIAVSRWT